MYLGLFRLSIGIATVVCARAQIESVTIKPVTAPAPCQVLQRGVRLVDVIEQAYGLDVEIGSGPPWIWTQALDIHSNLRPETPADHASVMMQQLLAERFHLKVHRLAGEREVDWLVIAKGGLKMRRARSSGCSLSVLPKRGVGVRVVAAGYTMASIAASLSLRLKTNVIDKTALDGAFDSRSSICLSKAIASGNYNSAHSSASTFANRCHRRRWLRIHQSQSHSKSNWVSALNST